MNGFRTSSSCLAQDPSLHLCITHFPCFFLSAMQTHYSHLPLVYRGQASHTQSQAHQMTVYSMLKHKSSHYKLQGRLCKPSSSQYYWPRILLNLTCLASFISLNIVQEKAQAFESEWVNETETNQPIIHNPSNQERDQSTHNPSNQWVFLA